MNRRHLLLYLAPGAPWAALTVLTGCAGAFGPQVITLGEAELAALIKRAFPLQKRLLELVDVQLAAPSLRLLPERNRLAVDLTLSTTERLTAKSGRARLAFECALRYEPRDASVRLTQVQVQRLDFESGAVPAMLSASASPSAAGAAGAAGAGGAAAAPATTRALARLSSLLTERTLEELALYRVPAERLARLRELGLQPGAVTVTSRGLEITLARAGA